MRFVLDTLGGCWRMFCLLCITRFRLKGPYWSWRMNTAFGSHPPKRAERLHAAFEYARWTHRMRRLR